MGPRGYLQPRLFFRRGDIVWTKMDWSEKANSSLLKPRTVTDVEQKETTNDASFWLEVVLVVSAEKDCP